MAPACPDVSELERFVSGDLDADAAEAVDRHSSVCDACRQAVADVRENLDYVAPVRRAMDRMNGARVATESAAPESLGAYRIIREIGRGGMGVVYEAEQSNPRRQVAVKVLHASWGADGRIQKMFRREANALGRLKHPAIAAIYEAGQGADGRSFLAMELVSGTPLTEFAQGENLDFGARLALFQRICEAIAYAHQRGVIHRDLKPSNILVDASGQPKILDFGLARILDPDESTPAVTAPNEEGRIQGTLPYMSPEQVRGDLHNIDIRSDVYSLGVVLYELLSGKLPYPIDRGLLAEAARVICEQPPARLSAAGKRLDGDIETIVLKALEKEPDRRYSGASALGDDIGRLLGNQPILARPPTLIYQVRKLVARHRAPAALVAAIAVLTVGFAVSMGVMYRKAQANFVRAKAAEELAEGEADRAKAAEHRAAEEAERAKQEAEVATQVSDFLVGAFRLAEPDVAQGRTVTAREILDAAAKRVRGNVTRKPAIQAALMKTMGEAYAALGLYPEAAGLLKEALSIRQRDPEAGRETAETACALGELSLRMGDLPTAEASYVTALAIMKEMRAPGDFHDTMVLQSLADVQRQRGNLDGAEKTLRELLERHRADPHAGVGLLTCLNILGGLLSDKDEYTKAVPVMREALEIAQARLPEERSRFLSIQGNLAWSLVHAGELDEAEELIRDTLSGRRQWLRPGHPAIATSLITYGVIHLKRDAPAEAEPLFREAVEIREKSLAGNRPEVAEARGFLGECLGRLGRYDEAEKFLLDSHAAFLASPYVTQRERIQAAQRLRDLYERSGQIEKARRLEEGGERTATKK